MDGYSFAAPKPTGKPVRVYYVGDGADTLLDVPLGSHACSVPLTGGTSSDAPGRTTLTLQTGGTATEIRPVRIHPARGTGARFSDIQRNTSFMSL